MTFNFFNKPFNISSAPELSGGSFTFNWKSISANVGQLIKEFLGYPIQTAYTLAGNAINWKWYGQSSQNFITIDDVQYKIPSGYTVLDKISGAKTSYCLIPSITIDTTDELYAEFILNNVGNRMFGADGKTRCYVASSGNGTSSFCGMTKPVPLTDWVIDGTTVNKVLINSSGIVVNTSGYSWESGTLASQTLSNFGINTIYNSSSGTATSVAGFKSLYIKKSDGTYSVNMVAMKNSSDVLGMYDLVNNVFYTNQGTVDFTAGSTAPNPTQPLDIVSVGDPILPSGYTELESITFPSGAYLTTNIIPKTYDYKVTLKGSFGVIGSNVPICAYGYMATNNTPRFYHATYNSKWLSSPNTSVSVGTADTDTHTFVTEIYEDNGTPKWRFSIDGIVLQDNQTMVTTNWASNTLPFYIGARNNNGTAGNFGLITAKQWSVKKAGVLVANYIPAKRNSDSEYGMYDTITDTFYPNAGTGTFTAGSEISPSQYKIPTVVGSNCGMVDLGTLVWARGNTSTTEKSRFYSSSLQDIISKPSTSGILANIYCSKYDTKTANEVYLTNTGISVTAAGAVSIYDSKYSSVSKETFKDTISGVYLYYQRTTDDTWTAPTITTTYLSEPLRKVGTYADYMDYTNQQVVRNICHCKGSDLTLLLRSDFSTTGDFYLKSSMAEAIIKAGVAGTVQVICSYYSGIASTNRIYMADKSICAEPNYKSLNVKDTSLIGKTQQEVASIVADCDFYFVLETPTTETATIPALTLAEGTDNITTNTTVAPSDGYTKCRVSRL